MCQLEEKKIYKKKTCFFHNVSIIEEKEKFKNQEEREKDVGGSRKGRER